MFFNFTQLFWYKLLFITELLICETLFAVRLPKRRRFAWRLCLSITAVYAAAFFFPVIFNAVYISFMFLALFAMTMAALKACFGISWRNVFFCSIAAFTVQHIAYLLHSMAVDVFSLDKLFTEGGIFDPYGSEPYKFNLFSRPISALVYFNIYFLICWAAYFGFGKRIGPDKDLRLGNRNMVFLAAVIVLANVAFNIITIYNSGGNLVSLRLERLYNLLTCMLALYLQFSQLRQKEISRELAIVNQLLSAQKKQYELSRQNIETINIKCHDLKHQLRALRKRNAPLDKEEIKEIEKAMEGLNASVKTGNAALDIVLTEKSLYCEKNKIKLLCIADGKKLDFIRASDIYALFGNAVDNAIEAVQGLEEPKRIISLIVRGAGNIVSIHFENCFSGEIEIGDGMPKTNKSDKANHGFGMLSIKTIAEKYGGAMTAEAAGNIFSLDIIFTR